VTTGTTTTTVVASSSGQVDVSNRAYQLYAPLGSAGTNSIDDYMVSNAYFLPADSPASLDCAFTVPDGDITQTSESSLHVGSETVTFIDTTLSVTNDSVPEPSSLVLLAGLHIIRRRP
jgi:hypothetical protein